MPEFKHNYDIKKARKLESRWGNTSTSNDPVCQQCIHRTIITGGHYSTCTVNFYEDCAKAMGRNMIIPRETEHWRYPE